jgi:hypothetical protein
MWNDITLALVQSSLHLILQVAAIVATHPLNIRAHMPRKLGYRPLFRGMYMRNLSKPL